MIRCSFHLNGRGLSILNCPGVGFFPAYSGYAGPHRNNPGSEMIKKAGPLPRGTYYIVARAKGGTKSQIISSASSWWTKSDRSKWFSLYRADGVIDDTTFIGAITRDQFRLHPAGRSGISEGCITFPSHYHFDLLRNALLSTSGFLVAPGLIAYGTIQVY
ncbi:DUF2778 domain-containing protein [Pseudomonas knackmussii]|uniref:DUF2778 domain-containing protein n=1 Tax=Pseudomonas knackmussii TaxID=65741 RepID=UPI000A054D87